MMCKINELIDTAISSRYKTSPWGYVPFPRFIPKIGQVRMPEIPKACRYSPIYERVQRHRLKSMPLSWPMGRHSLIEIEEHFRSILGEGERTEMLVSQLEAYINAWQYNIRNVGKRLVPGAIAFLKIWEYIETQNRADCPKCEANLKRRATVSTKKLQLRLF